MSASFDLVPSPRAPPGEKRPGWGLETRLHTGVLASLPGVTLNKEWEMGNKKQGNENGNERRALRRTSVIGVVNFDVGAINQHA